MCLKTSLLYFYTMICLTLEDEAIPCKVRINSSSDTGHIPEDQNPQLYLYQNL